MLRIVAVTTAVALLSVTPATASFGIWCTGPEGVSFDAPLSGGKGLTVMSAKVEAAGRTWSTDAADVDAQPIVPAQSWGGGNFMWFDFSDPNLEDNVVEVRISWSESGDMEGTLKIINLAAWDVACVLG